jgi:hypothetical protein
MLATSRSESKTFEEVEIGRGLYTGVYYKFKEARKKFKDVEKDVYRLLFKVDNKKGKEKICCFDCTPSLNEKSNLFKFLSLICADDFTQYTDSEIEMALMQARDKKFQILVEVNGQYTNITPLELADGEKSITLNSMFGVGEPEAASFSDEDIPF